MKKILIVILILLSKNIFGQTTRKIVKDLDGDGKKDSVYIDSDVDKLFCSLSTDKYKKIASKRIARLNFGNTLVSTKNGFEFWNDFGRSGFINEFKYNHKTKKMQLILIKRTDYDISYTEYGDKVRGGSGKSSINLLTNQYIGNFYDVYQGKLRKLPAIKAQIIIPETNLDNFSADVYTDFEQECIALYEAAKKKGTNH